LKKTIGLIYGGASGEHDVSILSATGIIKNIDYSTFDVKLFYINRTNQWFFQGKFESAPEEISRNYNHPYNPLHLRKEVDVVFPITHGPFGEDGRYQAIFDIQELPYVGCNVLSSAISMDKAISKDLFKANMIPQAKYLYFTESDYAQSSKSISSKIDEQLGFPCFVKPANMGSSVGISKVNDASELNTALQEAFRHDSKAVVEEFIEGRELEIGFLGNNDFLLSTVGEIRTGSNFYDYDSKYFKTDNNEILIPAPISPQLDERIRSVSFEVIRVLNLTGISRIDFFYSEKNDQLLVNEVNTLPGFTPHSMYPSLFADIGIPYTQLITKLVDYAFESHSSKKNFKNLISKK
jgi:D-alanine-D-alanine ligase